MRVEDVRISISIHAPRGGSDYRQVAAQRRRRDFNPRSPWGERQDKPPNYRRADIFQSTLPVGGATAPAHNLCGAKLKFQSTLPVGGATVLRDNGIEVAEYFNPRSPWGERRHAQVSGHRLPVISIHAPRGGSDRDR